MVATETMSEEYPAFKRLRKDYLHMKKHPLPLIHAEPLPSNILEWHYILRGPPGSLYEGGMYHGKLLFTEQFPFKPPSIFMITPNGRFKTNTRLCLSISDYHPDTWSTTWSVGTILQGIQSFMLEDTNTLGAIYSQKEEKRQLAAKSLEFNVKDKLILELFPDIHQEMKDAIVVRQMLKDMEKYGEGSSKKKSAKKE